MLGLTVKLVLVKAGVREFYAADQYQGFRIDLHISIYLPIYLYVSGYLSICSKVKEFLSTE